MDRAGILKAWFLLFRPWSYTATLVPFISAAAFVSGFGTEAPDWRAWALGLASGMFLQATVNLLNTWGDEKSGVDDVPGAIRTTPQIHDGVITMRALLIAAATVAFTGGTLGLASCFYSSAETVERFSLGGGWYFNSAALAAGFAGVLGSTNYSTGIKFKYRGLGVPFVSVLMGPIEMFAAAALLKPATTAGCFWNPCETVTLSGFAVSLLATLPVASLVGVIMHGNDMRDIPSDRAAGIVTFASRLGPRGALGYYRAAHVIPYAVCVLLLFLPTPLSGVSGFARIVFLMPFLCVPLTLKTLRLAGRVYETNPSSPPWRGLERMSGKIHLVFGVLYSVAWVAVYLMV